MSRQAILEKELTVSAAHSRIPVAQEPDSHEDEREVFTNGSSEDWSLLVLDRLPSGIQHVPMPMNWGRSRRLSSELLVRVVYSAATSVDPDVAGVEEEFAVLASRWHDETDLLSSPSCITGNENYLRVIAMGTQAVAFILLDLRESGGYWYPALRALTGDDPVPAEFRGDVEQMKGAWFQWGKERGLIGR